MKYILRLIVLPFWFVIGLVHLVYVLLQRSWLFLKHGGECITYLPEDRTTIKEIYDQIKCNSIIYFSHDNK
jgi:hypothetical protein